MTTPQPGDFGLVSISGNVGFLIRLGQFLNGDGFADYEHAFIYIGNGQIVEAEPGGARIAQLSEYDGRSIIWSTGLIDLTDDERNTIVEKAVGQVGTSYSFLDYFAILFYRLGIKIPSIVKRVEDDGHLICSVLVAYDYGAVGIRIRSDFQNYLVTPGYLRKYLANLAKNDRVL